MTLVVEETSWVRADSRMGVWASHTVGFMEAHG